MMMIMITVMLQIGGNIDKCSDSDTDTIEGLYNLACVSIRPSLTMILFADLRLYVHQHSHFWRSFINIIGMNWNYRQTVGVSLDLPK
jgi:hypothetical protein